MMRHTVNAKAGSISAICQVVKTVVKNAQIGSARLTGAGICMPRTTLPLMTLSDRCLTKLAGYQHDRMSHFLT